MLEPLIFPSYFPQPDFGPASKSAITCRIRRAVTKGEAAIATSVQGKH
jgi:hypothetical protein